MTHHAASVSSTPSRPTLSPLRLQAAIVRALLDELDERAPLEGGDGALVEQLADELARLGRDALGASATLARVSTPPPARTARLAPHEAAEDDLDPIPHWLPLVAF